jgi:cyclic pyranopterin phosphate synthase
LSHRYALDQAGATFEMLPSGAVKLYRFDGVDERLELVPLAARRALDRAGLKLSLEGWRSLSLADRRAVSDAGSGTVVDLTPVTEAVRRAEPAAERVQPVDDPPSDAVPADVRRAFGERGLDAKVWSSLSPLARYALAKVATRGRAERISAAYDEIIGHSATSPHLDPAGGGRMVDVAGKAPTLRRAVAESRVKMNAEAFGRLLRADAPKGDVLGVARLAGVMAAKRTPDMVPLCHPISLTHVSVELSIDEGARAVHARATVEAVDRTGVEMEALVAATASALTVYDMLKAFDRAMEIGPSRLLEKSGGRSGDFRR